MSVSPTGGRDSPVIGSRHSAAGREILGGRDQLVSRFQLVADHTAPMASTAVHAGFGVPVWVLPLPAHRAVREHIDQVLTEDIAKIHLDSDSTYGSPRITAKLRERSQLVNHKRIARFRRLMRCRLRVAAGALGDPAWFDLSQRQRA
jgi:hypothetical protein